MRGDNYMKINAVTIQITISEQEARDLAYHIKHSLEKSILEHYIQTYHDGYNRGLDGHAKPLFEEQCRPDLNMMNKLMACASGEINNYLEDELWLFLKEEYSKKNAGGKI